MKLVHFADCHIGYRQFSRDIKGGENGVAHAGIEVGKNQREADVEATFRALVNQVIGVAPDVIVIPGDVFHSSRPSNGAILFAFNEFGRLRDALPNAAIVVACGNHDVPLTKESATIVNLLAPLRIRVADREARRFEFPELELSVLAIPDAPGMVRPPLEPDPYFKHNLLVLHGEVQGMLTKHLARQHAEIPTDEIQPTLWDYVALGHYHVHRMLAPNMGYSGSIDYTSTDPWGERAEEKKAGLAGKGFIERDLATGAQTFHPLPSSRDHIDLTLSAEGMTDTELSAALRELLDDAWVDDAIARVVVTDCPRDVQKAVDHKMVREYQRHALNLKLDYRRPEIIRVGGGGSAYARRRAMPIDQLMTEFLARRAEDGTMAAGVSLEAVTALSRKYLGEAAGEDPALVPALEASVESTAEAVA